MDIVSAAPGTAPLLLAPALRLIRPLFTEPAQDPLLPWDVPEPPPPRQREVPARIRRAVAALTAALVEVLRGRRPLAHLEPHAGAEVIDLLARVRAEGATSGIRLASVRVSQPADRAVEATARFELGRSSRAAALRFARRDGRWRLVAMELALDAGTVLRAG